MGLSKIGNLFNRLVKIMVTKMAIIGTPSPRSKRQEWEDLMPVNNADGRWVAKDALLGSVNFQPLGGKIFRMKIWPWYLKVYMAM